MPVWILRERGQSKTVKRAGHLSRKERQALVMVSSPWLGCFRDKGGGETMVEYFFSSLVVLLVHPRGTELPLERKKKE